MVELLSFDFLFFFKYGKIYASREENYLNERWVRDVRAMSESLPSSEPAEKCQNCRLSLDVGDATVNGGKCSGK